MPGYQRPAEQDTIPREYFMVFSSAAVMSASFSLALGTLFCSHLWLHMYNLTTVEVGKWGRNEYNLGWWRNIQQVFGAPEIGWVLPIRASRPLGDGLAFP